MKECIYCRKVKEESGFSLEHIVPQFLGGSRVPNLLKTKQVCKICNNNLGLFVDASFEKSFLVYSYLTEQAYAFYDPDNPTALPLRCFGTTDLSPPHMVEGEICELWIGPLGEQIIWIRPDDKRLYWYSGGNPRTVKSKKTRAYFLFSDQSSKDLNLSWLSLKNAFEGRRVKKIICNEIDVAADKIGFDVSDDIDNDRIEYFLEKCTNRQERRNKFSLYSKYDLRFLAKLAIGVSFSLLGEDVLRNDYMDELNKALWHKEDDPLPNINGVTAFNEDNQHLKSLCGYKNATTIIVFPTHKGLVLNLNISQSANWVIKCAEIPNNNENIINNIGEGVCFILFKPIQKCITLSLPEFIEHKEGISLNHELSEIDNMVTKGNDYIKQLLSSDEKKLTNKDKIAPSRNLILLLHKPSLNSGKEGLLKFTFLADLESKRFF
ncbi:HNH endonuclease [Endozoicomonas sp. 4G]|uniref:HNH endonuclease n=1 Tax=Endozoicomonas sp. 4G TaxID=2872754 RepID=UPI00207884B5|nr:HNH endonuclease [Endozoicomonas sp. 4G]